MQLRGRSSSYSSHLLTGNHLRRRNHHNPRSTLRSILCSPRTVDLALQCAVLGALSLGAFGTVLSVGKLLSLLQEYLHPTVRPALRAVTVPESPIVVPTAAASYPGRLEIRSLRDPEESFQRRIDPIEDARLYEQQRSFALLREDHTPDAEAQAESADARHDSPGIDRGIVGAAALNRPRDCARTAWRNRPWRPTCNAFHEWRAVTAAAGMTAHALRRRDGTQDPLLHPAPRYVKTSQCTPSDPTRRTPETGLSMLYGRSHTNSRCLRKKSSGAEKAPRRMLWRLNPTLPRNAAAIGVVDRVLLRQGSLSVADASTTARTLHDETHMHSRVAEALTSSSRIAAIYGSCGLSDLIEDVWEDNPASLGNEGALPTRDVLDRAIALTEALAELHGADGGVAVHGALRLEFVLPNRSGKLQHFYGAELLDWSAARQTYCDAPSRTAPLDRQMVRGKAIIILAIGLAWGSHPALFSCLAQHLSADSSTSTELNEQTDLRALGSLLFVWLMGTFQSLVLTMTAVANCEAQTTDSAHCTTQEASPPPIRSTVGSRSTNASVPEASPTTGLPT